jgi:hypothetical protein
MDRLDIRKPDGDALSISLRRSAADPDAHS